MAIAILYLVAIGVAEALTTFVSPGGGIIFHAVLLATLIAHSSLTRERSSQSFLLCLSLVPLLRIVSFSMPLAPIAPIYWYLIVYPPLFVGALIAMWSLGFRPREVGLTLGKLPLQLAIGLTGVVFGIGEYFILSSQPGFEPLISELTWVKVLLPALILIVCTGFTEEFIFRGVLQRASGEALGHWGIVYVSVLFALVHLIHHSAIDILLVFVIALFFAWIVKRTHSLLGVSLSHGVTNIVLYLILPFLLA